MKKEFNLPEIEIVIVDSSDVIATSGTFTIGGDLPGYKNDDWKF